ncbi:hypothetical protein EV198_3074 [Roseivirga ehrenbergii]|uniref:Bacterial surface antigen (D15) domain-containing protein n=1 Tax=Roseivirga ehrenbergii (strain DSM 102268 / JCM 13514 / KCTC 12282 / NCIMB 14502 / KMM 6017) TaxID=279360 RepID=A0A150XLJ5_ROSEK|nr:hypothetical protein [Roseivirga ehrenbergii]KYG79581.1 hypothetical protein MB14_17110 [Roseivirga ehrenbergii]TCL01056.1 hypothetical protein EV198_3074 [Roseivirga ehrenbergii]
MFSLPSDDFKLDTTQFSISENPFKSHNGKIIGNIELIKLKALGTRMDKPEEKPKSFIQKTGNTVNFNTRERVILNNLLFSSGDIVDPLIIADNERILRELPYIKDARIYLKPREDNPEIVDVEIITKDVLALSFDIEARDFDSGVLRVNHKNIFGSGHEIDNRFSVDHSSDQRYSYQIRYRVPNIKRSFISFEANYANTVNQDFSSVKLQREFISPKIKFAGGIEFTNQRLRFTELSNIISDEEYDFQTINQRYDYQDFWLARAFPLNLKDPIRNERTRLIVSGRISNIKFTLRPEVDTELNQPFHNRTLAIGSVGISQRRYFKDQLIFGYGRTEDIPYGYQIELLGGYEWAEFGHRYFLGGKAGRGGYMGNLGYFLGGFSLESFLKNQVFEQGVFKADFRFFSSLIDLNRWKFRQFINVNYTYGIDRFSNEYIDIRDGNGIRGLKSNTLRGTQRFLINIETVSFTPFEAADFKLAVFGFYDLGMVNNGKKSIFSEKAQSGIGLGFRIRNDNLTFKAIEIRLAYYPDAPVGIPMTDLSLSGNSGFNFSDFLITRPSPSIFR